MADSPQTIMVKNQAEWKALEKNLHYLYENHDDKAVRMAVNEVARKAKVNVVKAVASEPLEQSTRGRTFRNQAFAKTAPIKARNKDIRPLIYVRGARLRSRPREAVLLGYANDLPAIRFATTKSKKTGESRGKGQFVYTRTHGKARKPGGKGRKLKNPTTGGIKVGRTKLDHAFINVARYNKKVHIFRRTAPKTWRPGKVGWGHAKDKAPQNYRMPVGVLRYDVYTPMKKKFGPVVKFTVAVNAQDSYNRAMGVLIGKAAQKYS